MSQNANDGEVRLRNYLSKKNNPEAKPIPTKTQEELEIENKKELHKNDDTHEYDIHEEDTVDDRDW